MDCWTALAWAAGATAFVLSPGLLLEIPTVDKDGKPDGVGWMTGKTNIWAMVVHALVTYVVMRMIVIPMLQRTNQDCGGKAQVPSAVAAALQRGIPGAGLPRTNQKFKSQMRSYVVE